MFGYCKTGGLFSPWTPRTSLCTHGRDTIESRPKSTPGSPSIGTAFKIALNAHLNFVSCDDIRDYIVSTRVFAVRIRDKRLLSAETSMKAPSANDFDGEEQL